MRTPPRRRGAGGGAMARAMSRRPRVAVSIVVGAVFTLWIFLFARVERSTLAERSNLHDDSTDASAVGSGRGLRHLLHPFRRRSCRRCSSSPSTRSRRRHFRARGELESEQRPSRRGASGEHANVPSGRRSGSRAPRRRPRPRARLVAPRRARRRRLRLRPRRAWVRVAPSPRPVATPSRRRARPRRRRGSPAASAIASRCS